MKKISAALLAPLFLALPAIAAETPIVPGFGEETKTSGIDSVYAGEWQYMVGGGAAVVADVAVVAGSVVTALIINVLKKTTDKAIDAPAGVVL